MASSYSVLHVLVTVTVFLMCIAQGRGDAAFEFRLLSLDNSGNRLDNGECCSGRPSSASGLCRNPCTAFVRFCAAEVNITNADVHNLNEQHVRLCTYGVYVSEPVLGRAPSDPTRNDPGHLSFALRFPGVFPGNFTLILEAWHKTSQLENATFIGGLPGYLIARVVTHKSASVTGGWTKERDVGANGTVTFDYVMRAVCQPAFFGANCSQMCLDRNNDYGHYVCTEDGRKECRNGWGGETCTQPICKEGCHTKNGYCIRPGECRCHLGWKGSLCDECVALPGCMHGVCRNSTFECSCQEGWDGLFCSEPICKNGCHSTRGYCRDPDECRCRLGWDGELCDKCKKLPGCVHGSCTKPFECLCETGWQGLFCQTPTCQSDCHPKNGYCNRPGECRCRVGWTGSNCDQCVPYPGCVHGNCTQPWECVCQSGWGGVLCDEELRYCESSSPCQNGGTCISRTKDDGSFVCFCPERFTGKFCQQSKSN